MNRVWPVIFKGYIKYSGGLGSFKQPTELQTYLKKEFLKPVKQILPANGGHHTYLLN